MPGGVLWVELLDDAPEPDAPGIVLDDAGTTWVRAKVPGRPDAWYRVGGGRGDSWTGWAELARPLFLAASTPSPDQLAVDIADRLTELGERHPRHAPERTYADRVETESA